jgi:hypothetical protein
VPWTNDHLSQLDADGYPTLDAIAPAPYPPSMNTLSKPAAFICVDGRTYWCKGNTPNAQVQQGLMAELIAGRLASLVSIGGPCRVVRVLPQLLPADGSLNHLAGVVVGTQHHDGMEHVRNLAPFIGAGTFAAGSVDASSRARTIAFQSWIGAGDAQLMMSLTTGKMVSIDHGDCFSNLDLSVALSPVLVDIPGVGIEVGKDMTLMDTAVGAIEALDDQLILEAVSCVPSGDAWNSDAARRLEVAEWLAVRKGTLRGAMEGWVNS